MAISIFVLPQFATHLQGQQAAEQGSTILPPGTAPSAALTSTQPPAPPALAPPQMPAGKATVIGGAVRKLDRVKDEITVRVFGGKDLRVLYDGRTKVYRDGKPISVRDLHTGDSISLETVLDGKDVFAKSMHTLTHLVEGESSGQVLSYDAGAGVLVVRDSLSPEPIRLRTTPETQIVASGQETGSATQLGPGALVSIVFQPSSGKAVAQRISILAAPGHDFFFSGTVASLDLHSGHLVIVDPRDQKRYEVTFDAALMPNANDLRVGNDVSVRAGFDGTSYKATSITKNDQPVSAPGPQ